MRQVRRLRHDRRKTCRTASATIYHTTVGSMRRTHGMQFRTCAHAGIHQPETPQLSQSLLIKCMARTLPVLRVEPSGVRLEAKPPKVVDYSLGIFLSRTSRIEILHAHDPSSMPALHRQPRDKRSRNVAKMHPPCGRRREPSDRYMPGFNICRIDGLHYLIKTGAAEYPPPRYN